MMMGSARNASSCISRHFCGPEYQAVFVKWDGDSSEFRRLGTNHAAKQFVMAHVKANPRTRALIRAMVLAEEAIRAAKEAEFRGDIVPCQGLLNPIGATGAPPNPEIAQRLAHVQERYDTLRDDTKKIITSTSQVLGEVSEERALLRLLIQNIHTNGRITDEDTGVMERLLTDWTTGEPTSATTNNPQMQRVLQLHNTLLQRRHRVVADDRLVAAAGAAVGVPVPAASPPDGLDMVLPAQWQRDFILRALQSDALLRQMSPTKRAAAQLLDLYGHLPGADRGQFELFKKAFASMGAAAAVGVVRRHFWDGTNAVLEEAVARLVEMEGHFPEMGAHAAAKAAEEALCLMHLENACRRVGVRPLTRAGFSALYLGEYNEVRQRFAGYVTVRREDMIKFLRDEEIGKAFWRGLCTRAGLPVAPYDGNVLQIEHILNTAWGGADHYLNYMALHRPLNNSAEFRYGPGEVKMILLGAHKFAFVQRFARWDKATDPSMPRDAFLKIESEHYALPAVSLRGRQLQLRESLAKRARTP